MYYLLLFYLFNYTLSITAMLKKKKKNESIMALK
jgi:hypothetical protein